jgi:hypothetical protein
VTGFFFRNGQHDVIAGTSISRISSAHSLWFFIAVDTARQVA